MIRVVKSQAYWTLSAILLVVVTNLGCTTCASCGARALEAGTVFQTEMTVNMPRIEEYNHRTSSEMRQFVRFAQCQFSIETKAFLYDLPIARDPAKLIASIRKCVALAIAEDVDVLIFPELALQLPQAERKTLIEELRDVATRENLIIIGGSFYDDNRLACVPILGPGWVEFGHKFRPSRYECSTISGKGMIPGAAIPVVHTDCGSFVILTCVDLISDQAQYVARHLATQRRIHTIINNCWNGAALEFLTEANSIARRHPVFVQITNVSSADPGFGHTCLLGNLAGRTYSPNSQSDLLAMLPSELVEHDEAGKPTARSLPYDCVVADLGTAPEALLVYELNLLLPNVPSVTNGPDQGYPPVRNLKVITLDR